MDKKLFNSIYQKYYRKDYFGTRNFIKSQLIEFKRRNIKIPISQIKTVLKNEREKAYYMILNRIDTARKNGKKSFPLREKLTHEILKKLNIN